MSPVRVNLKLVAISCLVLTALLFAMYSQQLQPSVAHDELVVNLPQKSRGYHLAVSKKAPVPQIEVPKYLDGRYPQSQKLAGMLFTSQTQLGDKQGEITARVTLSVVKSLSRPVIEHIKQIFSDDYNENIYFATIPAMLKRGDHVEIVQRIWLAQFERMKIKFRQEGKNMANLFSQWQNSWQENYFYHMQLDNEYNLIQPGEIMGIPTTTNVKFTYKSDGLMDPRLFTLGSSPFLIFHTWLVDKNSNNEVSGRVHIWDMERKVKKKLWPHIALQRTEINWIPLDINGELYLTYSIDPLRVMKCQTSDGDCQFVYEQEGSERKDAQFLYTSDHLRGGTPWIQYKYPYYISVAHNVVAPYKPYQDFAIYNANLVVLDVKNWRVVYVSRNIKAHPDWLKAEPIIRNHTILESFWYPTGIVLQTDDIIDISCHLNDASGHILRLRGIKSIMDQVMAREGQLDESLARSPSVRVVQQYVLESAKAVHNNWTFYGDYIAKTVEGLHINL